MQRTTQVAALLLLGLLGCSNRPARVPPPEVDAADAGRQAIETYDQDGNGSLSREEIGECPALLASFDSLDADSSGSLSGEEIENRIRDWQTSKAALVSCRVRVLLNGRPLRNAEVRLEPVGFLQPGVLPASGVTTDQGFAQLSVAAEHLPAPTLQAMNWGFYNVTVVGPGGENRGLTSAGDGGGSLGVEVSAIGKNETILRLKEKG